MCKARFTAGMEKKEYTGLTATTFKQRYYNHRSSFRHRQHQKDTRLSEYVWATKDEGKACSIQWAVHRRAAAYGKRAKGANWAWRKNWQSRKYTSTSLSARGVSLCQSVATRVSTTVGASNHPQPSPNYTSKRQPAPVVVTFHHCCHSHF